MDLTGAVLFERRLVGLRAVALVDGEAVFGVLRVELRHEPVTADLCEHGRGGDGGALAVPADQIVVALRCLRVARFDGNPEAIHVAQHHFDRLLDRLCDQLAEAVSA